jgi:hypothetical protein
MVLLARPIGHIIKNTPPSDTLDNSSRTIQSTIKSYQDMFRAHLEHTIRRGDVCFPSEISPLLKSLALYTCTENATSFVP